MDDYAKAGSVRGPYRQQRVGPRASVFNSITCSRFGILKHAFKHIHEGLRIYECKLVNEENAVKTQPHAVSLAHICRFSPFFPKHEGREKLKQLLMLGRGDVFNTNGDAVALTYLRVSETVFSFFFSLRPAHGSDMFRKAKQARRSTRERQEEEASNLFVVASNAAIERLPRTADRSSAFGVAGGGAYGVFL